MSQNLEEQKMSNCDHTSSLLRLGLVIAVLLTGCSTTSSGPTTFVVPVPPPATTEYLVQPGDTLDVKFYYHPDHNQEVLVRPDGKIVLTLIGEMPAAGSNATDLGEQIAKRYAVNLRDPKVGVTVKSVNQTRVYVGGEVLRPGFVQFRPGLTAVQALLDAGGPKDTADMKEAVLLQRVGDTEYRPTKVDLAKVIEEGDTKADMALSPSDVIFVPKTGIAKANVWVDQYIIKMLPIRPGYSLGGL